MLHNGKPADEAFSIHQAVVVKDGKIVAVGGNDLFDAYEAIVNGKVVCGRS